MSACQALVLVCHQGSRASDGRPAGKWKLCVAVTQRDVQTCSAVVGESAHEMSGVSKDVFSPSSVGQNFAYLFIVVKRIASAAQAWD